MNLIWSRSLPATYTSPAVSRAPPRGAEGGCRLSAELNRVTLYDLMTAMGEDSRLSSCMDPTYSCPWRASHGGCTVHCHLTGIQEKLNAELKAHTLEDILGPAD